MNAIAAWLLFAGALSIGIPHSISEGATGKNTHLLITTVVRGSPAAVAGLIPGDEVIAVKSEGISPELIPTAIVAFVSERGGEEIEFTYRRADSENTVVLRPAHAVVAESKGRPAVGIGLDLVTSAPMSVPEALKAALSVTYNKLLSVLGGLGSMVTNMLRGAPVLEEVVGPIGLVGVVGDAAQHGFANVLILAGFISLNLAVVNLIPIPALDGGRLALLGFEALMRRNASHFAVQLLNTLGIGLIAVLMIVVTYNDIVRLFA